MKTFTFVLAAVVTVLFLNPRAGVHYNGQVYATSCSLQVAVSVGPNGIGYSYFPHANPFSGLAMQGIGC